MNENINPIFRMLYSLPSTKRGWELLYENDEPLNFIFFLQEEGEKNSSGKIPKKPPFSSFVSLTGDGFRQFQNQV